MKKRKKEAKIIQTTQGLQKGCWTESIRTQERRAGICCTDEATRKRLIKKTNVKTPKNWLFWGYFKVM